MLLLFIIPFIVAAAFLCIMSILRLKLPAFNHWIDDNGRHKSRWHRHPLGAHPVLKQNFLTAGMIIVFGSIFSLLFYWQGTAHVMHNEVWNYKIVEVQHWEEWTTEESYTESYACGTDSDGNTKYCTRRVYYTAYHGPYWYAIDQYGKTHSIDKLEYNKWRRAWGTEKKKGFNKGSSDWPDPVIDGNIYSCNWTGEFEEMFTWHSIHSYENRIRSSHSVFKTIETTEETISKWPRPADNHDANPIHSIGVNISGEDQLFMQRINCLLGPVHEVHTLFYVFDSSKYSSGVIEEILSAWDGPNKNELCVFIGIDKNKVINWISVESWADNTQFHAMIENNFLNNRLIFRELGGYIRDNIGGNWQRKSFEDFEYIQIKISFWWYFAEVMVSLLGGFGALMICKYCFS